ncbi:MAG: MBL fold metallo-hydrolase [Rhodothermales bacterium]
MTRIGPYELHAIETGTFALDGGAMFGIVPKPLWTRSITPDAKNRIPMHMRCLLLIGEGRVILIDNGLGDKFDAKFASIYAVDQETTNLHASLAAVGVGVDDVTDVILTHLHFDHCGGSTRRNGERLELVFPNATIHVQRDHWHWAEQSNVREQASFLADNLAPIGASGLLNLIDGAQELFPGLAVEPMNGHTKGQQVVHIYDAHQRLVYVADLLPTHAHLRPAWNMAYDLWPMKTIAEKAAFLERAVDGNWSLFFEHDAAVEVADVTRTERGVITTAHRRLADG